MEFECFTKVRGTFNPKRTDDLREGAAAFVGRECVWMVWGEYEDGQFQGQQQLQPQHTHDPRYTERWPFLHAPRCDVDVIEVVRFGVGE